MLPWKLLMRLFEKQSGKIGIGKLALVLKYLFSKATLLSTTYCGKLNCVVSHHKKHGMVHGLGFILSITRPHKTMSNICLVQQQTFVMKNDVQTVILYLTYIFSFCRSFQKKKRNLRTTHQKNGHHWNQISLVLWKSTNWKYAIVLPNSDGSPLHRILSRLFRSDHMGVLLHLAAWSSGCSWSWPWRSRLWTNSVVCCCHCGFSCQYLVDKWCQQRLFWKKKRSQVSILIRFSPNNALWVAAAENPFIFWP